MIKFKCEFCDQRLGVPDDFIGKRVRCTKCRAINTVPSAEERAAKDAAKSAATLSTAPRAALSTEPPPGTLKMSLHSSLLDMSSGSGSFAADLPVPPEGTDNAKIFGTKRPVPEFDAQQMAADDGPGAASGAPGADDSAICDAKTEEELSFDESLLSAPKPEPKKTKGNADEEFGLSLLEEEPTDSSPGKVDLDGLGF